MNNASPQKGLAADPRILMKIGYIIPQFTNSCSSLILFCHPLVRVGGGSVEQPHGCRIGWDQTWRKGPGCGLRHRQPDADRQGLVEIYRVLKPGGRIFLADFNPPANPVLAHITTAFVGHGMMQTNLLQLPAMLAEAGFLDISSGGTRSAFLSFVSGRKPAS